MFRLIVDPRVVIISKLLKLDIENHRMSLHKIHFTSKSYNIIAVNSFHFIIEIILICDIIMTFN